MPLRSTTSFAARCLNAPALSRPKAVTSVIPKRKSTSTPCGWSNNHSHESPCGSFFLVLSAFPERTKEKPAKRWTNLVLSISKEPKKFLSVFDRKKQRIDFFSLSKRSKRNKQSCLIRLLSAVRKKQRTVL